MSLKMRPATQENVGVPNSELEAREAAAQAEVKTAEAVAEAPKTEEPKVETVAKPEIPTTYPAVAKTPVNLRREPKLDSPVLSVLFPGIEVEVSYFNSEWYKLTFHGTECYVRKEYMIIKTNK